MEKFVYSVTEVKFGAQLQTLVFVQLEVFGRHMPVRIHAVEEDILMLLVDNVTVLQDIGMEIRVQYVQILKYGTLILFLVYVQVEIGMDLLVSAVHLIKFGSQHLYHVDVQQIKIGMELIV